MLQDVVDHIRQTMGDRDADRWKSYLPTVETFPGANIKFKRIMGAKDSESVEDILVELYYALIFRGLGFSIIFEPLGAKGPDMSVERDGHSAMVEVTRFRPDESRPGPPIFRLGEKIPEKLPVYGNSTKDIKKATDKIVGKFKQASTGGIAGLIVLWNDDMRMEEIEVKWAVDRLKIHEGTNPVRSNVPMVIYGSSWVGNKQFYCYELHFRVDPFISEWKSELESYEAHILVEKAIGSH